MQLNNPAHKDGDLVDSLDWNAALNSKHNFSLKGKE